MTGSRVEKLQRLLVSKGFVLEVDGAFGMKTLSAVKVAKAWAGHAMVNGAVGPAAWDAIDRKKRTQRPVSTAKALAGRPKIIDARRGKAGFPRHQSRTWQKRSHVGVKLGHYTGGPASFIADAKFHVFSSYLAVGGAPALAYALGVDKDGTLFVFNDWHDVTWHCDGGHNTDTLGVVFRGGSEGPNLAQRRTLSWLWKQLEAGTFRPPADLHPWPAMRTSTTHKHVNSTSCPGVKGEEFYRSISPRFRTSL
jgi:peptidoglycan hydrolase-like protein with peptidoglycan-binding domain